MKVVFLGTSSFAVPVLEALHQSQHSVVGCVTQPDRPKGRGMKLQPSPVKERALALSLAVVQPQQPTPEDVMSFGADIGVLAAYGRKIDAAFLQAFPKGIMGLHPSLLPKYRGAAPINWAIINGDTETASTFYQLNVEWDAGDILLQETVAIGVDENAQQLTERLSLVGAAQAVKGLDAIASETAQWLTQPNEQATRAPKLTKDIGQIDWTQSVTQIYNRMRGLAPWPGTFTQWQGQMLKLIEAKPHSAEGQSSSPGTVLSADAQGILVQTGKGQLLIYQVQPPNRRAMDAAAFLAGHALKPGNVLGD